MPLQAAPGLARTEGRHIRGVIPGPIEASFSTSRSVWPPRHIRGVIPGPIEASLRPGLFSRAPRHIRGVIPGPIEASLSARASHPAEVTSGE